MVETRGSRRKSVGQAAAATPSKAETAGAPSTNGVDDGDAAILDTINMYRQQFLQQRQEEQRTVWSRFVSWVNLRWYQYEMTYGPYMLELWERNLVLAFIISVVAFTLYGTYSVVQRFLQ